ncbi:MAG: hypothetical protein OEN20_10015, partial [Gammaproteobacteria bacterium]|nr:hypothetical protein [Gammaproteobacteria bacterium]
MHTPPSELQRSYAVESVSPRAILDRLQFTLGIDPENAGPGDWCAATAYVTRDLLMPRWLASAKAQANQAR